MADDIVLADDITGHEEGVTEDIILDTPAAEETARKEAQEDNATFSNSHGVANVVAAIDAFLSDPNDLGEESHEPSVCQSHCDEHDTYEKQSMQAKDDFEADEATAPKVDEGGANKGAEARAGEATDDDVAREAEEQATLECGQMHEEEHNEVDEEEEHDKFHIIDASEDTARPRDETLSQHTIEDCDATDLEREENEGEEDSEAPGVVEHDEADVSIAASALSHGEELNAEFHDEAVGHEDVHVEHSTRPDNMDENEHTSRRSSAFSARSAVSDRRTSMRTEALIQAAARAVVAKINEKDAAGGHFDIARAMSESHDSIVEDADHDTTTDEEGENDHEGDAERDDDDVFSDRSPRSSLGSFEHHSGASNNGIDEGPEAHQKMDLHSTVEDATDDHESQDEYAYAEDTGSVAYHRGTSHYSPRMSGVSGISRMSQYEQQHEDDEEEYKHDDEFVHHTIRGTPRAAFRTPSSVRAIQMSSPSPSVIYGVSPRSAARRRRLGTGSGLDDGQSMGSVGTYSSLPGSPSKSQTPTRFKVFRKPEPAPLVLLHATLMPTRWVWSDVLRTLDEDMGHNKNDVSLHDGGDFAACSFEPSAALKRLHGAWCQLQEYSLGTDTVAERGVLLPHPQNDYEVLEERLLEALELPVRRRARILECGHYLGPADDDDEDEYEDEDEGDESDGYYNDHKEEGEANKRHWCTTCRSDIRYESLGAERVFRVKVYASNGLMAVGAWAACWSEMERVDVEIEPIVADAALLRELNQLRSLQQKEALHKQEADAAAQAAMAENEIDEADMHGDDLLDEPDVHDLHEDREEHQPLEAQKDISQSPAMADHFHLSPPSVMAMSPPLRDSPVEPPALTTTDRTSDANRRRREAEDRLREIYGRTPPHTALAGAPTSPSRHVESTRLSDVPETVETAASRDMGAGGSRYGPSPPSPSAEAYNRREERRSRQSSTTDRAFGNDTEGAAPHASHPHAPYESASLPELLLAAIQVFLRDRKHVAITVLSVIVIVLATLRSPGAGDHGMQAVQAQVPPATDYGFAAVGEAGDARIGVEQKDVEASLAAEANSESAFAEMVSSVGSPDFLVETVVEKMTVKVYETVTETATETATQTTVATATSEATVDGSAMAETATVEAMESSVESAQLPSATFMSAAAMSANTNAASLFAAAGVSTSAANPTADAAEVYDEL
ncbi:hypothetical protein SPBR_00094 [Sporothrix brasiliensis 5110]|uniref:Pathway-specific nitrogen regulator n=1 Tax=Sporothrix brasiliensis 5110 TaxID=1398154 RepID=A0A0C2EW18_9PEZI|nr:uncharacterized protein SPBR_00094 [Sporothrix brasiliensis 5110]KIH90759.1 hypothetical protein SPBR_00094 [Sporothrix brasiliensis 5110]